MRLRTHDHLHKTLSFGAIHLAIAVTLGWLFTGTFILGGLLALVEPTLNTVVAHRLDRLRLARFGARERIAKSGLLALSHLVVAMGVGWALTGSWIAAGAYAVVEPLANAVAHYFFEGWWGRRRAAALPAPAAA
jgi:uncharacterized membrane protein